MPWLDGDRQVPFQVYHYLQPFLVLVLPTLFFSSMLFFAGGALSKNLLFVFVQGIGILVLWSIAVTLGSEVDNKSLAALLDPTGLIATDITSQYWGIAEQNTLVYAFDGLILANRLIWIGVGLLGLALTLWRFKFSATGVGGRTRKKKAPAVLAQVDSMAIQIPTSNLTDNFVTQLARIWHLSRLYFREIILSVPFIAITLMGMVLLIINSISFNSMYGTATYPTTYQVLEVLEGFDLFFLILIVFYGRLSHRPRFSDFFL